MVSIQFIVLQMPVAYSNTLLPKGCMVVAICDICSQSDSTILWRVDGYDVLYCPRCDLIYTNVDERDIECMYEESYYKSVYPDYEVDRNIHAVDSNTILDTVEKYSKPGTLFEIGSAFGFFLECAAKKDWRAVGYETSRYASSIARDRYGLDVKKEDFLNADVEGAVDVVCLLDTIEHLINPSLYRKDIPGSRPAWGIDPYHGGYVEFDGQTVRKEMAHGQAAASHILLLPEIDNEFTACIWF